MADSIEKAGGRLHILRGPAVELIPAIAQAADASAVYWTRRYDASGIAIDRKLKLQLRVNGVEARSFNGQLLFEPWDIATKSGGPYSVYTPFWKAARAMAGPSEPLPRVTKLSNGLWPSRAPGTILLDQLGLLPTGPDWAAGLRELWEPGEAGARRRLASFLDGALKDYATARDRPDRQATSLLSPHLAFGEISPRSIWCAVRHGTAARPELHDAESKFLSELGWREFSYHLLFHNPDLATKNHNPRFDAFPWRTPNPGALQAWQTGRTGIPIVDAGMRELWRTGFMHNRVRMIAASFLTKNLLIDWRVGEQWFWDTLCDADSANNPAGWQWVAGCGADASPYFRIFNPVLQGGKFDPEGAYTRRYVHELEAMPAAYIHAPWRAPAAILSKAGVRLGATYPKPLVDLKQSRARALTAYKAERK